ncbi:MAG: hypothetical protein RLZZ479_895 [Bacteroidota bacterium]|jgi:Ni,Fe-hydrogenase maturation factor
METNKDLITPEPMINYKSSKLSQDEIQKISELLEQLRKIYAEASKVGAQIRNAEDDMNIIVAKMQYVTQQENNFYKDLSERLNISLEEAKNLVLEEVQKNINEVQN